MHECFSTRWIFSWYNILDFSRTILFRISINIVPYINFSQHWQAFHFLFFWLTLRNMKVEEESLVSLNIRIIGIVTKYVLIV